MDMIINELPLDYLKYLYKYYDSNKTSNDFKKILEVNGNRVFEDTNQCLYSDEVFKEHPNIRGVNVSNYGRIASIDYGIQKQEIGSNDYLYIEMAMPIEEVEKDFKKINKINIKTPFFLEIFRENKYGNVEIAENNFEFEEEHPFFWLFKQNNRLFTFDLKKKERYFINPINTKNLAGKPRQIYIFPILVYRLVAETWIKNDDPTNKKEIHHIINNGYNNTCYNLMWVNNDNHRSIEDR